MKAWTLNSPTQSPGDLQHSWEQTKDVGVADALTDNVQQKDKDEEDKEDVDTEEASSLDETQVTAALCFCRPFSLCLPLAVFAALRQYNLSRPPLPLPPAPAQL